MPDNKRWFKVWTSILTDEAFDTCTHEEIGLWTILGARCAVTGTNGTMLFHSAQTFLHFARRNNPALTLEGLSRLIQNLPNIIVQNDNGTNTVTLANCNGKITVTLKKWHLYQTDSTGYERQQRHRSNERNSVTGGKCNGVRREQEETRREQQQGGVTEQTPLHKKAVVVLPSAEEKGENKNRDSLIRIGISPAKAMSLVNDFTPERIEAVLKALREANAKNPTGWVISALEDNWDLAKVLKQPKDTGASNILPSEAEVRRRRQDEKETFTKAQQEQEARQAAIKNIPPDEWEKAKELAQKALEEEFPHVAPKSISACLIEHKALELVSLTNET